MSNLSPEQRESIAGGYTVKWKRTPRTDSEVNEWYEYDILIEDSIRVQFIDRYLDRHSAIAAAERKVHYISPGQRKQARGLRTPIQADFRKDDAELIDHVPARVRRRQQELRNRFKAERGY